MYRETKFVLTLLAGMTVATAAFAQIDMRAPGPVDMRAPQARTDSFISRDDRFTGRDTYNENECFRYPNSSACLRTALPYDYGSPAPFRCFPGYLGYDPFSWRQPGLC